MAITKAVLKARAALIAHDRELHNAKDKLIERLQWRAHELETDNMILQKWIAELQRQSRNH